MDEKCNTLLETEQANDNADESNLIAIDRHGNTVEVLSSDNVCSNIYKEEATRQQYLKLAELDNDTADSSVVPSKTVENEEEKLSEKYVYDD